MSRRRRARSFVGGVVASLLLVTPALADEAAEAEAAEGEAGEGEASASDPEESANTSPQEPVSDAVFEEGLVAFRAGRYRSAAEKLWHYLAGNDQAADQYEWAELYLGRSLLELGMSHGAVEYFYNVAKERKRPELLPEALRQLERIIATRPHDRELLQKDLLGGGADLGALPSDVKAFVAYYQGRMDLLDGRDRWAARHFEMLERLKDDNPLATRYISRARYAGAVRDLKATHARDSKAKRDKRDAARAVLEEIVQSESDDFELKNDARRTIARLHFEEGRYAEALQVYESIEVPFLSREEATLFLEKAWARHYAGDYRGSLGILLTLDAPSYRRYFGPERFVLKALNYKALCHYAAAKGAARELLRRYGDALSELRRRRDPLAHPVLRRAAVQARAPQRELAFLESLQRERQSAEGLSDEHGLRTHLARIYDLKIAEVVRRLDDLVQEEAVEVATELLDYEEQARLVDYEVSLEVFKRLKKGTGKRVVSAEKPIPLGSKDVYYVFDQEYWNDELHDYRFRIEDRCFSEELFQ